MTSRHILPRKKIADFIDHLYDADLHAKRVLSLANATLGVLVSPADQPRFEVVACIAGRGFGVRREDMRKLLLATRGKVFTLQNLRQLVEHTRLAEFRSR